MTMAMTIAGAAAAIEAAITVPITSKSQFALAIATALIPYIQNNAVVTPAGTPPLTVGAAPGPVVGTGKVT